MKGGAAENSDKQVIKKSCFSTVRNLLLETTKPYLPLYRAYSIYSTPIWF